MDDPQLNRRSADSVAPSVLLVIDQLGCGGAERQLVELACHLETHGMTVAVFSYRPGEFFAGRLEGAGVPRIERRRGGWKNLPFLRDLRSTMRRFDLVHAFRPGPCAWAALAERTLPARERPILVAAERSWGPDGHESALLPHRWIFGQADAVTVNNTVAKQRIVRLGTAESRVEVIGNGIDLARWDAAAEAACPLPLEAGRFNIAQIGSLRPEKNQLLTLRALAGIPADVRTGWRLWLVGDGGLWPEYRQEVVRAIDELGLGDVVRVSPALADIAPLIARLDALLLPSLREGFPNVALEAMASGVPVLGAPVGAMTELVEHQRTGLLVDGYEPAAWADAMVELAARPAGERAEIGRRARVRVEAHLEMEVIGARYRRLYARLYARLREQRHG